MARLKEMGLPYSRTGIKYWEQRGIIKFDRTPYGWIYFKSREDLEKKAALILARYADQKKFSEEDIDFSVKRPDSGNTV